MDEMDDIVAVSEVGLKKRPLAKLGGKKAEKKKLNLSMETDWFNAISENANTVTGYIIEAVREKMKRDGIYQ